MYQVHNHARNAFKLYHISRNVFSMYQTHIDAKNEFKLYQIHMNAFSLYRTRKDAKNMLNHFRYAEMCLVCIEHTEVCNLYLCFF